MSAEGRKIIDIPQLRDRLRVFKDRKEAGRVLAGLLKPYCPECVIFAVPSGGVPVGIEIASELNLPLEIAVVSKITLPWNIEAGYGAVTFNGTVKLNNHLISRLHLSDSQVREGIESTLKKVKRRTGSFAKNIRIPEISGRTAALVDDGIASGFTLLAGMDALKTMRPAALYAAAPTGNMDSVTKVAAEADLVFCANIRGGRTLRSQTHTRSGRTSMKLKRSGCSQVFSGSGPAGP